MKKLLVGTKPWNTDLATLILRLAFGGLFIYYGLMKYDLYDKYAAMFPDYLGFGPKPTYLMIATFELSCGVALVLGLLTRLAIIPILVIMIVVYFEVHKKDAFVIKQLEFFYLFICLIILILGSGRYSLDALLFNRKRNSAI